MAKVEQQQDVGTIALIGLAVWLFLKRRKEGMPAGYIERAERRIERGVRPFL